MRNYFLRVIQDSFSMFTIYISNKITQIVYFQDKKNTYAVIYIIKSFCPILRTCY